MQFSAGGSKLRAVSRGQGPRRRLPNPPRGGATDQEATSRASWSWAPPVRQRNAPMERFREAASPSKGQPPRLDRVGRAGLAASPGLRFARRASVPGRSGKPRAPRRRSGCQGTRSPAPADPASLRQGARRPDRQDGQAAAARLTGRGARVASSLLAARAQRRRSISASSASVSSGMSLVSISASLIAATRASRTRCSSVSSGSSSSRLAFVVMASSPGGGAGRDGSAA